MTALLEQRVASFSLIGRVLEEALHRPEYWTARIASRFVPVKIRWADESLTLTAEVDFDLAPGEYTVEFIARGASLLAVNVTVDSALSTPAIDWRLNFTALIDA